MEPNIGFEIIAQDSQDIKHLEKFENNSTPLKGLDRWFLKFKQNFS